MSSQALTNQQADRDRHRDRMEAQHPGLIALMHECEVVGLYQDRASAYSAGVAEYGLGACSFEEIGAEPIYVSHPVRGRP